MSAENASNKDRDLAAWAARPGSVKRRNGPRGNLLSTAVRDARKLAGLSGWKVEDGSGPLDAERPVAGSKASIDPLVVNPLALGPIGHRGMAIAPEPAALPLLLGQRPAVIAANHSTEVDHALVLAQLPASRRCRTVLVSAPGDKVAPLLQTRFPVIRVDHRDPGAAGMRVLRRIQRGWTALVFGEGAASADGSLGEFTTLPAELARRAEVPLVPAAIRGAFAAENRRTAGHNGQERVAVRFGDLIRAADGDPAEVTERLRASVKALLVEDATSWWAAQRDVDGAAPSRVDGSLWRRVWEHTAAPRVGGETETHRIWR